MTNVNLHIESREQLIAALGEAAEIEHNLMCCYLYAMFSLKRSEAEGINAGELAAIERWRRVIRSVALEEMVHLALVANLTSAVGGTPHFLRPNFPASSGFYPASVVIELAPFTFDALDHFIFLERPDSAALTDGKTFKPAHYARNAPSGRLMPFAGDYLTIGDLYHAVRNAIDALTDKLGERDLFCGEMDRQIHANDNTLSGITAITDLASAHRALDMIVIQGEGSVTDGDSHFARFSAIKKEYQQLLAQRADFMPARPAARNPVMRPPVPGVERVHVIAEPAATMIDLANALYAQMLRMLQQVYVSHTRSATNKRLLLSSAYALMQAVAQVAERLTYLPATPDQSDVTAGMSFATIRMLTPLEAGPDEVNVLSERINELLERTKSLAAADSTLKDTVTVIDDVRTRLSTLSPDVPAPEATPTRTASKPPVAAEVPATGKANGVEIAVGKSIEIHFEGKRCIHSRHCVLDLPQVFLANTPGEWIRPDATSPEKLVAVAENCPSGAIRYLRRDGSPAESAPPVNVLNVRENGPLALHAPIVLRGDVIGYRATLCRCGRSNNKPFCDGSHIGAFVATGEPVSGDVTPLTTRDGPVTVSPQKNGPLEIIGNLEICSGTGRTAARITQTRLCRCGNSKNKPFCDGSHITAGFVAD